MNLTNVIIESKISLNDEKRLDYLQVFDVEEKCAICDEANGYIMTE